MPEHAGSIDSGSMIMLLPVIGVHRRIEETRVVTVRTCDRHVSFLEGEHFLLFHTGPVGYIVVHERRVIDECLISRGSLLAYGSKLDIVIDIAPVAPEDGVEDHTAVADIDTSRPSVSATVVGYIQADAVIAADRSVVDSTSVREIDTSTLGGSGIVIDDAGGRERRVLARFASAFLPRVLSRYMGNHQSSSATCGAVGDMAMTDGTVLVDADAASVSLVNTHTRSLTGLYVAELDYSASVRIYTASAHRGVASLHDTVPQVRVTNHIHAATVSCMLAQRGALRSGVTARDHTSID